MEKRISFTMNLPHRSFGKAQNFVLSPLCPTFGTNINNEKMSDHIQYGQTGDIIERYVLFYYEHVLFIIQIPIRQSLKSSTKSIVFRFTDKFSTERNDYKYTFDSFSRFVAMMCHVHRVVLRLRTDRQTICDPDFFIG